MQVDQTQANRMQADQTQVDQTRVDRVGLIEGWTDDLAQACAVQFGDMRLDDTMYESKLSLGGGRL